jgi:hypothetical protein
VLEEVLEEELVAGDALDGGDEERGQINDGEGELGEGLVAELQEDDRLLALLHSTTHDTHTTHTTHDTHVRHTTHTQLTHGVMSTSINWPNAMDREIEYRGIKYV